METKQRLPCAQKGPIFRSKSPQPLSQVFRPIRRDSSLGSYRGLQREPACVRSRGIPHSSESWLAHLTAKGAERTLDPIAQVAIDKRRFWKLHCHGTDQMVSFHKRHLSPVIPSAQYAPSQSYTKQIMNRSRTGQGCIACFSRSANWSAMLCQSLKVFVLGVTSV